MQSITIKQDAAALADLDNGRVISAAFKAASISCPNCKFPQNCVKFRSLLYDYTEEKMTIHRLTKIGNASYPYHIGWGRCHDELARTRYAAGLTRNMLQAIWPCDDCKTRFNPTGKLKLPPFNAPKGKDFLE
jgi:uncharacterized CHY-type Zn-finger protein